jgi:tripartite-type tricarboxylate transporter receptor subunit TctC
MTKLHRIVFVAALFAGLVGIGQAGHAQPADKTIRIIYPFPPGSAGDTLSRVVAAHLQKVLGRSVIVENRAGAGGITGIRSVVASDKDGSILLVAPSATVTMIPIFNPETGYDARKDLMAISHLVSQDLALGVGPALPAASLKEMIEIVRKDPAKGSYGTPGAGSSLHLIGVKIGQIAGIKMVPVHYRGASLALNDVVAGQLPMMLSPMPDQIEQHRAGKVRILATAGPKRTSLLDGVPTLQENGIDINAMGWFAAFAPAGVPSDLINRYSRLFAEAVQQPENVAILSKLGFIPVGTSSDVLTAMVNRDLAFWAPIFKDAGFKN